jgi:hypothetical protein
MMAGLNIHSMKRFRGKSGLDTDVYELVLYDTGLFYDQIGLSRRAEIFGESVIDYLKIAKAPVIVLAEPEIAELIRNTVKQAGFSQIDQPYEIEVVVKEINSLL